MLAWLSANLASVLLMAAVFALIVILICVKFRQRKKGSCGYGCGGCANCGGCGAGHKGGTA